MKNLNRKKYKETIKSFRDTCPIAQLQHKWVHFKDQYNEDVLMFVYNSIVKRDKTLYAQWHGYEYGEFYFNVILYGAPVIRMNYHGLDISHWDPQSVMALKNTEYHILGDDEVMNMFHKIINKCQNFHEFYFKMALQTRAKKNKYNII